MPLVKRGRVLVLGEDTNAFLATIRSLGRYGLDVHVAWCPLDAAALRSRYVKEAHHLPAYREGSDDWVHAFQALFLNQNFTLVLPLTDDRILPFQLRRREFETLARFNLLPDDVYRVCSDKGETYKLAVQTGVPVPRQRTANNLEEALECAREFGYPLVLKPKQSATKENPSVRQAVHKVRSERELLSLTSMTVNQELLVQENFLGKGVGVEMLCKNGRVLTAFQHERVHEPMMGGGSSYRKSVPLHEGMSAAASRLMAALQYTGAAMVEYKQNDTTGEWVLIEINGRFWGSMPLTIAAGLDFPRYLYEMLIENRADFPTTYRCGVFSRNWTKDMDWLLANLRSDRTDPSLQSLPLWTVVSEAANVLALRERSDTLKLDDPSPAWADLKQYIGGKLFRILKSFKFYRYREQRRLTRLYRSANRVLVICSGNICRSPFAANVLQGVAPGKVVKSAGTLVRASRESPEEAVAAAAASQVNLSVHRSRTVTSEDMKSSDLVIIFDRNNWLALRSMCPAIMSKVAYLGAANPREPLEVQDPFGRGLDEFYSCYRRLQTLAERLAATEKSPEE